MIYLKKCHQKKNYWIQNKPDLLRVVGRLAQQSLISNLSHHPIDPFEWSKHQLSLLSLATLNNQDMNHYEEKTQTKVNMRLLIYQPPHITYMIENLEFLIQIQIECNKRYPLG